MIMAVKGKKDIKKETKKPAKSTKDKAKKK